MSESQAPKTVHLVGSIGLDTVEEVFGTVGKLLGPYLRRIPDGEVGGRRSWISWQYPVLRANPLLRPDPSGAVRPTNRFPLLALAEGVASVRALRFGELGYAREARASYLDFVAARDRGELPTGIRFQVCLPTPFAVVSSVVVEDALARSKPPTSAPCWPRLRRSAATSRTGSLHPVGPLQRDGDLGWPDDQRGALSGGAACGAPGAHDADLRCRAGRCRARPASLLRRFRRPPLRRAEGRVGDGGLRQCARRDDPAQARLHPHAGADRAHRRRVSSTVRRARARRREPSSISAWCTPRTGSRARGRASPPPAAMHPASASPPNAAWRAPARTRPSARCSRFIPTFARVIEGSADVKHPSARSGCRNGTSDSTS